MLVYLLLLVVVLLLPAFDGLIRSFGKQVIVRNKWLIQQSSDSSVTSRMHNSNDTINNTCNQVFSVKCDIHSLTCLFTRFFYSLTLAIAIGTVESPYQHKFGTPKQATIAREDGGLQEGMHSLTPMHTHSFLLIYAGILNIKPEFVECLQSLDKFDMLWVVTYMHRNSGYKTKIKPQPRKDSNNNNIEIEVGLFSSRAPHRPNPIAMSALKINRIDYNEGWPRVL